MMDIDVNLHQWFLNFFNKNSFSANILVGAITRQNKPTINIKFVKPVPFRPNLRS